MYLSVGLGHWNASERPPGGDYGGVVDSVLGVCVRCGGGVRIRCDTDGNGQLMDFVIPCVGCSPAPVALFATLTIARLDDVQTCPGCGASWPRPFKSRSHKLCEECRVEHARQYHREYRRKRRQNGDR